MANNRIFWAVQAVGIAPQSSATYTAARGVQNVGITTTFNLEQVFELGQLSIYENVENIPDIEVTMEKVIDGHPLLYHLCTSGRTNTNLTGRANRKCNVALNIYSDLQESASGTPVNQVEMSGMYISSVNYSLPVDGNCTEAVTIVGSHKVWKAVAGFAPTVFNGLDTPSGAIPIAHSGVQRRENVVFASSLLPIEIPGISASGTNDFDGEKYGAHVQQITINCDFGREPIYELGQRREYFRFMNFPVEVGCDIEIIAVSGDMINASEKGKDGFGNNLSNQTIKVVLGDTTTFNLGSKNKLTSVSYGGGDTGGGQANITYSYQNFNDLDITSNQDPG